MFSQAGRAVGVVAFDVTPEGRISALDVQMNPEKLADLNAGRLSSYQTKLRERGASENTIKGHLAHIGAALRWAKRMGLLAVVPNIEHGIVISPRWRRPRPSSNTP